MPWFKVDDGFATSKAVLRIPRRQRCQAIGLWTLAGTWCAKELTDGFVPEYVLEDLGGTPALARALVDSGLWNVVEGGWQFVGWEKYQPSREQVLDERAKEAERKRKWREARKAAASRSEPQVDADVSAERPAGTPPSVPELSQPESEIPDPSRPDPSRPLPKGSSSEGSRKRSSDPRGTRLPEEWQPPDEVIRKMRDEYPYLNLRLEHDKFTDHWNGQPGAKGRKADWTATWRNWMRRAAENPVTSRNGKASATDRAQSVREMTDRLIQNSQETA